MVRSIARQERGRWSCQAERINGRRNLGLGEENEREKRMREKKGEKHRTKKPGGCQSVRYGESRKVRWTE